MIDWKNHILNLGDMWVYYLTDSGDHNTAPFDISAHLSAEEQGHVRALLHQYPSIFAHNPKAPRKSNLGIHAISIPSQNFPIRTKFDIHPNFGVMKCQIKLIKCWRMR